MASPAQIAANRANADLSTGPRTDTGKDRASHNALTHGATSRRLLIGDETQEEFDAFLAATLAHYAPANEYEIHLATSVAVAAWRHQRLMRLESAFFAHAAEQEVPNEAAGTDPDQPATRPVSPGGVFAEPALQTPLRLVLRYITSASRELRQAMKAIDEAQARRREADPEPTARPAVRATQHAPEPTPAAPSRDYTIPATLTRAERRAIERAQRKAARRAERGGGSSDIGFVSQAA